jgi:hypothetical protein
MPLPQSGIAGWDDEAKEKLVNDVMPIMMKFYSGVTGKKPMLESEGNARDLHLKITASAGAPHTNT